MCCAPRGTGRTAGICTCGCGGFPRRFISASEEKKMLESYKEQLQKEIAGVEERITALQGK